ncbi:hypothetical protein [Stenotrophomonas sp. S39]|uniref:hypothetical protein n=1 Tax=Stenotrophomonas sp. S39 TaxID=2767451 RepID=UPI00190CA475|nr:hypothetical protein [Stenotrophomonas sp. S39]MBK0054347.1 hypothetical protein [Stenotrophomonas sp. S39]
MAIKASLFEIKKDLELPLGSLIRQGESWLMRVQMKEFGQAHELTLIIAGQNIGEINDMGRPTKCVTLSPEVRLEVRIDGPIEGPSVPPVGALVWSAEGKRQAINTKFAVAVTMDGQESSDFPRERAFYAPHWSIWPVDDAGKALTGEPLFTVKVA